MNQKQYNYSKKRELAREQFKLGKFKLKNGWEKVAWENHFKPKFEDWF